MCAIVGVLLLAMLLDIRVYCEASSSSSGIDAASIPILASGKRQHNIMRFGKRPAAGHSLIHFGKREPQHSFLYFGKRDVDSVGDLLDYLQTNRDGSYKRGHSIMRFGKRAPDSHNFIRFGRGPADDEEDEKRNGHSMMYFGKRGNGHSMMYFGKRAEEDMEEDKRAHSMIHFGKRDMMEDDKRAHAMIHFGKREMDEDKRAHSMIHFGKRITDEEDRMEEEVPSESWTPELWEAAKRQHNLLRFGKKMDRKGSHAMIHFGKRDVEEDKRAHSMIHFGKRSAAAEDAKNQSLNRMKRESPLITLVRYGDHEDSEDSPTDEVKSLLGEGWNRQEEDWEPNYVEYGQPDKKASKNVFLRFG